jgi:hypothetical protein
MALEISAPTGQLENVVDGLGREYVRSEPTGGSWGVDELGHPFWDPAGAGPTDTAGRLLQGEDGHFYIQT